MLKEFISHVLCNRFLITLPFDVTNINVCKLTNQFSVIILSKL